ncbi:MAG: hypothetical protein FNNCIFGK_00643 [Bacteroidia bacterium]|nr:hypothetical protein [Bacteroidia bacterium]
MKLLMTMYWLKSYNGKNQNMQHWHYPIRNLHKQNLLLQNKKLQNDHLREMKHVVSMFRL